MCHPERSLPRFVRQTKSKDLRLFFNEFQTKLTSVFQNQFCNKGTPLAGPSSRLQWSFVSGHEFTRAEKTQHKFGALALVDFGKATNHERSSGN
jgi:hypothetical protein